MLNFNKMRERSSVSRNTASTTVVFAEGSALVADISITNGVKLATGTAGEVFSGVAITVQSTPSQLPYYEEVVADSSGAFELTNSPITGSIGVKNLTTGVTFTVAAAATAQGSLTASQVAQTATGAKTFVVPVARAGDTFSVGYQFVPTVAAVHWFQGDALPGTNIGAQLATVGVITSGDIYTSQFDTASDWSAAVGVKLAAGGLFTASTAAADSIPGTRLLELPSSGSPFLGLSIGFNG